MMSLALLALGCNEPAPLPTSPYAVGDAHNYQISASLDIPSFATTEQADILVDWAGLAHDFRCAELDPVTDIDKVSLMAFPSLTEEEIEVGLAADSLLQSALGGYVELVVDATTEVQISDLAFFTTDVDIELELTEGSATWMMLFTTGTEIAVGARMMIFLRPERDADALSITVPDACGVLSADAELDALEPIPVAAVADGWLFDWEGLATDGRGLPLTAGAIDTAMLARYDLTTEQLESSFLEIETLADSLWEGPIAAGTQLELTELTDGDDQSFAGFGEASGDQVWLLALFCSTCSNPAPLFLTRLEPVTAD